MFIAFPKNLTRLDIAVGIA